MARPGPGKGWRIDQIFRQAELAAELADLVLEQQAQRLDDLLEVDEVRQAANVVVALDDGSIARAGLDDVGVDRALGEIVDAPDLFCLVLKDADELLADDLALALRLRDPGELAEEAGLGIDADEVQIPLPERGLDLVALVLAHQPWSTKTQVSWSRRPLR